MFDYNCDIAQSYGVYENNTELEIAKFASSINISAGFHAGDPLKIHQALVYASENNIAIGAHIGYPDIQGFGCRPMDLSDEELTTIVIYQIGAIIAYAKSLDLEIEQVRCHGALKEKVNNDEHSVIVVANAVKKVNPWLNLIVQNPEIKNIVQQQGLKSAYEVDFNENTTMRDIRELDIKPDTLHFRTLEDIKRAYDIVKPSPINYNRVQNQI